MSEALSDAVILNVDDDSAGRYALSRLLQRAGYAIIEASSGEEALRLASEQAPDLVVLDVNLPDISGFEVARRLKADPATAGIPILHLSATSTDPGSIARGLDTGADAYLTEPVDPGVLLATIGALLRTRRAEEALRESEERYRGLVESQHELIVRVDPEGRFTFANESYLRKFGLTREEIIGKRSFRPLVHPDDLPRTLEAMKGLEHPPYRIQVEQRAFTVEGVRWIEWEDYAIREHGRTVEIQAIGRDITERKEAEEALHRQAALIDLSPDGIIVRRLDGTITFWSHGAETLYGWSKEEAVGRPTHDLLRTQFPQPLEEIVAQLRETGRWSGELIQFTRDGRPVTVQSWWLGRLGPQGEVSEILESNVDITDRKRDEQERERLLTEVERQRTLLDTVITDAPVGIALLEGPEHRYLLANPTYEAFTQGKGEIVGRTVADVFAEIADTVIPLLDTVYRTGKPFHADEQPLRLWRRGRYEDTFVTFTYTPWRDNAAHVQGILVLAVDVTDAVLTRQRLLDAERARTEIAERMTAEINHRMKNNLMLLSGVLEMQAMRLPAGAEPSRALRDTVTRLAALSVVHEQLYDAKSARVELQDVIRRAAEVDVQALAIPNAAVSVGGDAVYVSSKLGSTLALVANELVINALRHGAPGPGGMLEVEISLSHREDGLHVLVWNSGNPVAPGFDVAAQARLGLSLIEGVVSRQLEGHLALRPERGGTMAEVVIPERVVTTPEFIPPIDTAASGRLEAR